MEDLDEDQDYQNLLGDLNAIHAQLTAVYAQAEQPSSPASSYTSSDSEGSIPASAKKRIAGRSRSVSTSSGRAASRTKAPRKPAAGKQLKQLKQIPEDGSDSVEDEDEEQGSEEPYDSEEDWQPGAEDMASSEEGGEQGTSDQQADRDSMDSRELDEFLQDYLDVQGMQQAIDLALQQQRQQRASEHAADGEEPAWPRVLTSLLGPQRLRSDDEDAQPQEEGPGLSDGDQDDQDIDVWGVPAEHVQGDRAQEGGEGDTEWFQELPDGAPVPKGRLGALYEALAANRKLSSHLRDTVAARIERALDLNWEHAAAVRSAPATVKSLRRTQRRGSLLHRFNAPDPLTRVVGPSGQERAVGQSRYWVIDGKHPEPNADTLLLASKLSSLPSSYERTRWSSSFMAALRRGVEFEVRAHLLQEAASAAHAAVQQQEQAGGLAGLAQRFDKQQAVDVNSPEGQRITLNFTDEQWRRISINFVKERTPVDCKLFWLNSMRLNMPWTDEEQQRLTQLVTELGTQQWVEVSRQLGTTRTPAQCLQAWLKGSKPATHSTRSKQLWSPEDNARLEELVAQHGTNWVEVSAAFGGKFDRHQVRDRWHGQSAQRASRNVGRWSADEDAKLHKAVELLGPRWRQVAPQVGTRTPQQCRERWENVLKPDVQGGPWTDVEIQALKEAVQAVLDQHGRVPWAKVAARIPGRTDDMCRRAWRQLQATGTVQAKSIKPSPSALELDAATAPEQQQGQDEGQQPSGAPSQSRTQGRQARSEGRSNASSVLNTAAPSVKPGAPSASVGATAASQQKRARRPTGKRRRRPSSSSCTDEEGPQDGDLPSSSDDTYAPARKRSRGRGRGRGGGAGGGKAGRGGRGGGKAGRGAPQGVVQLDSLDGAGTAAVEQQGVVQLQVIGVEAVYSAAADAGAAGLQQPL